MNIPALFSSTARRPRWICLGALVALVALLGSGAASLIAAESPAIEAAQHAPGAPAEAHAAGEHHGIPPAAPRFGWFTNSMVVTWLVTLGVILLAHYATREMKDVPDGLQNFWEWLVESLRDFLESIMGRALVNKTFWFFATIFIFILFTNWAGLLPGVGSIGSGVVDAPGEFRLTKPWFRGVNADLNMTLAMATIFFACWIVWALQANGPGGFILHLFGPKGDTKGLLKVLMIAVFILVGLLEVVSILFRPISLSFRLFGNIYAGENMLESMAQLVPALSWLIPVPFYLMEVLVGLVQALVFMLLTAVFTLLICTHEEGHHPETEVHH